MTTKDSHKRKNPTVCFQLGEESIQKLDTLAAADHRTRSQYLQLIVLQHINQGAKV